MDELIRVDLQSNEKRRKIILTLFDIGSLIKEFGVKGLWPFGDGFVLTFIRLITHVIPWFFVYAIVISLFPLQSSLLASVIIYAVMYLAVFAIGLLVSSKPLGILRKMQKEYGKKYERFLREICDKYKIQRREGYYEKRYGNSSDNSVSVCSNGDVSISMSENIVDFELFPLNTTEQSGIYKQRILCLAEDEHTMENNIASIDFKEKFGVVYKKADELECMKYFNPTLQLQMINSTVLSKCYDIKVNNSSYKPSLTFKTNDVTVSNPLRVTVYLYTPVVKYFEEAEAFCKNFSEKADAAYFDLKKVEF